MAGNIHGVMQNAQHVNVVLGTVDDVQEEVAGRAATLRDVEQSPVRR
jgi:hypothetical protein